MNGQQVENIIEGLLVAATIVLIMYSPIARAIGQRILHGRLPAPGTPVPGPAVVTILNFATSSLLR